MKRNGAGSEGSCGANAPDANGESGWARCDHEGRARELERDQRAEAVTE